MVYSAEDVETLISSRKDLLGKCEYSASSFSVYSYYYADYVFDNKLIEDLLEFEEFGGDAAYEAYFLSMYDISSYSDEILDYMLGTDTYVFTKYTSSKPSEKYFDIFNALILKSNETKLVLWGIDPMIIAELTESDSAFKTYVEQHLTRNIQNHPEISFRVFFPPHSLSYYSKYSEEEINNITEYYSFVVDALKDFPNVIWDFPGDIEWIYNNPYIYEGETETIKSDNVPTFIGHLLSGTFVSTSPEVIDKAKKLQEKVCEYNPVDDITSDLSNINVVIFGDSIFDYIHNDTSIQNVFSNFSGADMLCYAICGTAAGASPDGAAKPFGGQFESVSSLKKDIDSISSVDDKLIFIIEFGINDYMQGTPIDNINNPTDIFTYKGAMRYYISLLRDNWPNSEILLLSPGYIYICDDGNSRILGNSPILSDYRKASAELAKELDIKRMDLTDLKTIPKESYKNYLMADFGH